MKKPIRIILWIAVILVIPILYLQFSGIDPRLNTGDGIRPSDLKSAWDRFSDGKRGKVVYAEPPHMMLLDLSTGRRSKIRGIVVEGGSGRFRRGNTPRPFWSPDGRFFSYRYNGKIYISDEYGHTRAIENPIMDSSRETRWSIVIIEKKAYLFGPSIQKHGILVSLDNPEVVRDIFPYPAIDKHCELTADGKFIVYASGKDIFCAGIPGNYPGVKISKGQSCRPCASPVKYVAWLPAPHSQYNIHFAENGAFVLALKAPVNEEIYRLNWSNVEEFAAHMFGSRGNTRMHLRKVNDGSSLYIGNGWDPDLWVGNDQ